MVLLENISVYALVAISTTSAGVWSSLSVVSCRHFMKHIYLEVLGNCIFFYVGCDDWFVRTRS
jgi:hypothetical protein